MIRLLNLLTLALTVVICFGLYRITNETRDAQETLRELNKDIAFQRETITVLGAEWQHLVHPARLQRLNEQFLRLQTVSAQQIATVKSIPMRSAVLAQTAVPATPPALPRPKRRGHSGGG